MDDTEYILSSPAMYDIIQKGDAEIAEGKDTVASLDELWSADHVYADIEQKQDVRTKEQIASDMEAAMLEAKAFREGRVTLKSADSLFNDIHK